MGFKILFGYPSWLILLCLIAGLGYAAILYHKNRRDGFSASLRWVLALLRFMTVFLISALLMGPLAERLSRDIEEPLLIFVQDNSQSIIGAANPEFDHESYIAGMNEFVEKISGQFDVRHYFFGEEFRSADEEYFTDRLTDISQVFIGIEAQYSNRNIGAVVLAGDGIFNRGLNPVSLVDGLSYPVYSIALGDTMVRKDLAVTRLRHNRITFLGNIFPVEVFIEARQASGLNSRLLVKKDGEIIASKVVAFLSEHHQQTVLFEIEADEPGMQRYTVELSPLKDEVSLENNSQSFYIDVIDGRQKVLILANAPHPDIGALKAALESQENYEVTVRMAADFDENPEPYNLLVLHQLPSDNFISAALHERIRASEIPVLYVIGKQTNLDAFNSLQTGMRILPRSDELAEVLPTINNAFVLFSIADNTINTATAYPPLYAPFAQYETSGNNSVLMFQRIGQVVTDQPLITFSQSGPAKSAVITGEGIWRWRLHHFMREGNHRNFDELISRMAQYLSVQEDKSLFRIRTAQLIFENDPVMIDAELYNQSYELVNDPGVTVNIINQEGISFPFTMARTNNAYQLNAGSFPPGEYAYVATATLGAEQFRAEGRFTVAALNLESIRTIADHNLLYQVASLTGGEMVYPGQWDSLSEMITSRTDIKPVMYSRKALDELINMKPLFFLILLLLSIEWFTRKRNGGY